MTTFKMLKPVAYMKYPAKKPEITKLDFQSAPSKSEQALGYVSEPLYTADALRDLLEQAALKVESQWYSNEDGVRKAVVEIRKMKDAIE